MYEDCYAECLIKRKRSTASVLGFIGLLVLVIAAFLLILTSPGIGAVVFVAAGICVFIFYRYLRVEYEYIFVQGELQTDRIYSESVRKKGPRIDFSCVTSVEPLTPNRMASLNRTKTEDYSSHYKDHPKYIITYEQAGPTKYFIFEPDANLLEKMARAFPSKIKKA